MNMTINIKDTTAEIVPFIDFFIDIHKEYAKIFKLLQNQILAYILYNYSYL